MINYIYLFFVNMCNYFSYSIIKNQDTELSEKLLYKKLNLGESENFYEHKYTMDIEEHKEKLNKEYYQKMNN